MVKESVVTNLLCAHVKGTYILELYINFQVYVYNGENKGEYKVNIVRKPYLRQ